MTNKYFILPVSILLLLSSCVGPQVLYKGLTKHRSTLEYLYDSPQNKATKSDTLQVNLPEITDPAFTLPGKLDKVKASVIPAIVYTGWKSEYKFSIGKNVIEEDVDRFTMGVLIDEFNRSTSIHADSISRASLQLDIEIDSIGAIGPYTENGNFLFLVLAYSYSSVQNAGPGMAHSRLNYALKDGNQVLTKGSVESNAATEPLKNWFKNHNDLRKFYSSQLIEALSFTLKSNVESIVKEVDDYITKNQVH